jgi:hypothetical protein
MKPFRHRVFIWHEILNVRAVLDVANAEKSLRTSSSEDSHRPIEPTYSLKKPASQRREIRKNFDTPERMEVE